MESPTSPTIEPRSTRVPFLRPVRVDSEDGTLAPRRLLAGNISRGGMFIRSVQPLPAGTPVTVLLEARGRMFAFAKGEVVWERPPARPANVLAPPGFGVRFTQLNPRSKALLAFLVGAGGTQSRVPTRTDVTPVLPFSEPPTVASAGEGEPQVTIPSEPPPSPREALSFRSEEPHRPLTIEGNLKLDGVLELKQAMERMESFTAPSTAVKVALGVAALVVGGMLGGLLWLRAAEERPAHNAELAATLAPRPEAERPAPPAPNTLPDEMEAPPDIAATPAVTELSPGAAPVVVSLTSGAVRTLRLASTPEGEALTILYELADEAEVTGVYGMNNPPRLVMDLIGAAPTGTARVALPAGFPATAVRLATRGKGMRLVLDLKARPSAIRQEGDGVVLRFHE